MKWLLAIFLLAVLFSAYNHGIAPRFQNETIYVGINENNVISINGKILDNSYELSQILLADEMLNDERSIVVHADKETDTEVLIEVMDIVNRAKSEGQLIRP